MDKTIAEEFLVGPFEKVWMTIQAMEPGEKEFHTMLSRPDNPAVPYQVSIQCGERVKTFKCIANIAKEAYYPGTRVETDEFGNKKTINIKKRRFAVEIEPNDVSRPEKSNTKSSGGKYSNTSKVE